MKKNRILLVGGGSGGHAVPLFHIYETLKKIDSHLDIRVIGSGSAVEKSIFGNITDHLTLHTGRIHRRISLNNIWQILLSLYGFFEAIYLINKSKPKIIFSKGGFVSVPILIWARILKIPYMIHESDIEMGLSNKISASGAKKVFLGFPKKYYPYLDARKSVFSGQIILDKKRLSDFDFGFTDKKPIIFFTGGSQGSISINRAVFKSLQLLLLRFNVIHQTGMIGYSEAIDFRANLPVDVRNSYFVTDFFKSYNGNEPMLSAINQSEIIVSRAGATTIAEIARLGKPMILIPYQFASANHQLKNAQALEEESGCVIIEDKNLGSDLLTSTIIKIFEDKEKSKKMSESAKKFFPDNAIKVICEEIIKEAK
jgi:UDP-N-acetylglucosamine--N-acetylmuramyl-(pentapeptide) pyrophosphoryl-undecaprenol N-acetylglucosamine transferase